MMTGEQFADIYETSGQMALDLTFLGLEDNDKNRSLLKIVIWSSANTILTIRGSVVEDYGWAKKRQANREAEKLITLKEDE